MTKKYELMDETIEWGGKTLHRIKALKGFGNVICGEIGGFIEKEDNLSHEELCWVSDNALVCGDAHVYGNARICYNARVSGKAQVYGNATVFGNVKIYDNARVYGDANVYDGVEIHGNARVYGDVWVCDNAEIYDDARVFGNADVYENSKIYEKAKIYGTCRIRNNAQVYGNARVHGNSEIRGKSKVSGNAKISGNTTLCKKSLVSSNNDYITFNNIGLRNTTITMFRCTNGNIKVTCRWFTGTLDKFYDKVMKIYGDDNVKKEYLSAIERAKIHLNIN